MDAGQSTATVFSSLIDKVYYPHLHPYLLLYRNLLTLPQVRLVYMSALLDTREELHSQYQQHALELAELRRELEEARGLAPKVASSKPDSLAQTVQTVPPKIHEPVEISWPVCSPVPSTVTYAY